MKTSELTKREKQILDCLIDENSNGTSKEIANKLGISMATVKVHLNTLTQKYGRRRMGLAIMHDRNIREGK